MQGKDSRHTDQAINCEDTDSVSVRWERIRSGLNRNGPACSSRVYKDLQEPAPFVLVGYPGPILYGILALEIPPGSADPLLDRSGDNDSAKRLFQG